DLGRPHECLRIALLGRREIGPEPHQLERGGAAAVVLENPDPHLLARCFDALPRDFEPPRRADERAMCGADVLGEEAPRLLEILMRAVGLALQPLVLAASLAEVDREREPHTRAPGREVAMDDVRERITELAADGHRLRAGDERYVLGRAGEPCAAEGPEH